MLSFQLWKHRRTFSLACLPLGACEFFFSKFSNESTVLTGTKEGFVTEWYLVSGCTASHHSIHNPPSFTVTRFASLIRRRWSTRDKGRESPTAMNFVSLQFDEIRIIRRCEMRQPGSSSFLNSNARCTTCFLAGSPSIYASKTASLWLCCLHQLKKGKADICRISATKLVASWLWIQIKDGRCFPLIDKSFLKVVELVLSWWCSFWSLASQSSEQSIVLKCICCSFGCTQLAFDTSTTPFFCW